MLSQYMRKFCALVVAWVFAFTNTYGSVVNLADAPLVASTGEPAKPNVYFIFDDSSSMPRDYMPDNIPGTNTDLSTNRDRNCFRNFGYNTIYYNPSTTYVLPANHSYTPTFTNARNDGFDSSSGTVDLSSVNVSTDTLGSNPFAMVNGSNQVTVANNNHGLETGDQVRFTNVSSADGRVRGILINNQTFTITRINSNSYRFTAASNANGSGNFGGSNVRENAYRSSYYTVYTSNPTSPPSTCQSDDSYTRVIPSGAERENFAIWYSYYRTRLALMKTASGLAFQGIGDKYRVGFSTTSEPGTNEARFLGNKTFEGSHKTAWYNLLYGVRGTVNGTPLRGALSKAGRYYAGRLGGTYNAGGANDPIQYACQRNFAILTTDGFWNVNGERPGQSPVPATNYGPFREDNSTPVGDQDGGASVPRPYRDDLARPNTLADVAMYYFNTDLRTPSHPYGTVGGPTDEGGARANVTGWGSFEAQNMYTFTLGLGVTDSLSYPSDLPPIGAPGRATSPLMQGTAHWPNPGIQNDGTAQTGTTVAGRTDDLWHAAENGRGRYISAGNADQIVVGLNAALAEIESNVGSSAAAATSNLQPIQDDNTAFVAQFETVTWVGNLVARTIDVNSGVFSSTPLWEAKTEIDAQFADAADAADGVGSRSIYTFDGSSANKLREFRYANLSAAERSWFDPAVLSQSGTWTSSPSAEDLVDFLRGDATLEGSVFRERVNLLGDIVNAAPVYVRKPPFSYLDPGYSAFASANVSRPATVYVGANDGMLHAINADTGRERWAYMPSEVLPNLKYLADEDYPTNHRFYVDGPITVGDAYDSVGTEWRTVLVAGLGKGGKGYFALDVTNPVTPKALWEFGPEEDGTGDADVGYSYGNPMITKRARDGRWVVIFSSGYNNGSPGDARGRIYVVDAFTGVKLDEYVTSTTNDENLSGIGRASNLVVNGMQDNTTQYVYAGDLRGSLWRFNINANSGATPVLGSSSTGVVRLGQTHAIDGAQPITVRPELARIGAQTVVYFGTGRFLGVEDIGDPTDTIGDHISTQTVQAIYAVKDTGGNLGVLGNSAGLVEQTLVVNTPPLATGQKEREIASPTPVNWDTDNGWFVEVPEGERFNVNPGLQNSVLVMAANIVVTEDRDRCNPQGAAVLYQLDYKSGKILRTHSLSSMVVGFTQLQLGGGSGGPIVINVVQADGTTRTFDQEDPGGVAGSAIRVSWRELE